MISLKVESNNSREKVAFPLGVAIDNVSLRAIEKNERILGVDFSFQRVEKDTISFLTSSILPPKKEWFTVDKVVGDKTLTPEEQYSAQLNTWVGYIRHILIAAAVPVDVLNNIKGESVEEFIDELVKVVNPLLDSKNLFYLKTVKDKGGYTKLPMYRGTGVAQSMDLGFPSKFVYNAYEQELMDTSEMEGVVDSTISTKQSGLDF